MTFRHHLRAHEHDAVGGGETHQRGGEGARLRNGVGVQANAFQLRNAALELPLESLGPGTDPRKLRRAAGGTCLRRGFRMSAVMTSQQAVAVQNERDIAIRAAQGDSA